MGTQLIFTVGTNPLPVWVAWYHLKDVLQPPIQVRLIHTEGTRDERKRLVTHCSSADFLDDIETSPGTPRKVRDDIQVILDELDSETTHLHVHYTGGTKVMSVETVAALKYDLPDDVCLHSSYLDPRGNAGPDIVDSDGRTLGPDDARQNVSANLIHVANINGFTVAPFTHEYWHNGGYTTECIPAPVILNDDQEQRGNNVLRTLGTHHGGWINPTYFEYAAYVALKAALQRIESHTRRNYKLFNKVHVRRTGAGKRAAHFELDVVAVLGYQIIVVSCTLETESAPIKEKGMEAIWRAQQLGGDVVQAIVLCQGHRDIARRIERELHDEAGSDSKPLQVWGTDKWGTLSNNFENYLRDDLHWR